MNTIRPEIRQIIKDIKEGKIDKIAFLETAVMAGWLTMPQVVKSNRFSSEQIDRLREAKRTLILKG